MKAGGNPKSEIRSPKAGSGIAIEAESDLWKWGDAVSDPTLALPEDAERQFARPFDAEKQLVPPYDLQERTAQFGERIVEFAKQIPQNPVNNRLISQLVGAATSIGANYCEADDAISRKEFRLRIGTARKESKETMFFLRMLAKAEPGLKLEARCLWREAKELNLIFGAIWRK